MQPIDRRRFLGQSTKGVVGAAAGVALLTKVRGARAVSANEKIHIAVVGVGGRGSHLARSFARRPDVIVTHLCDADGRRVAQTHELLENEQEQKVHRAADIRQVLDDREVDGVVVATPDHWHGPATVFACQAGKDVYVEKPASHNIWEGRKMVEAARKYGRIVQVGTQSRSGQYAMKALEYIRSGAIGSIPLCKIYNLKPGSPYMNGPTTDVPEGVDYDRWLGPAPLRPYDGKILNGGGWYTKWDFCGGDMGNDGSHQIDLARMLIEKDYPKAIHGTGGNFGFDDERETPDTQTATFDFDDMIVTFEMTQYANYMSKTPMGIRQSDKFPYWPQNSTRIELYGTKQLMIVGRHGGGWQAFTNDGKVVAQDYGRFPEAPHIDNFLECMRTRKRPNCEIEEGHRSAVMIHSGNIACRLGGRRLAFDAKTESFVGDDEANRLLKRKYRAPYVIPEEV